MGHVLLGNLPKSRLWNEVVRRLLNNEDADAVAPSAQEAADAAFGAMDKDPGFQDVVEILTQLGVAADRPDPAGHLATFGVKLPDSPTLVSVSLALNRALNEATARREHLSDLAIIGGRSLVAAVTQHLNTALGTLITPTCRDIVSELGKLGRETQFGKLAQTFFYNVAKDCQRHFLSKELGAHVGAGRAFPTTAQLSSFEEALDTHAREASVIVEVFAKDWFSKRMHLDKKSISKTRSSSFGWKAMGKIRAEMKKRAPDERS